MKLSECCIKIGSGATPRGGKESYLESGPFSLIRSQNVHNNLFLRSGLAFISEEQARQLQNVEVKSDDVLLNITGDSVARVCQVPDDVLPARVNQHVAIIRPDPNKLLNKYLRYFLVNPKMQSHMLSLASAGATRNALTKGMIESFELPKTTLSEQKAIASVLGALDDQIENNRQMNQTLEEMARAIFKSWFVDFDPVHAKAAGNAPAHMDAETAALFPNSFDDDGLPVGWHSKSLDQIADFLNGAAMQKFPAEGDRFLPVIKIAELRNGISSNTNRATPDVPQKYLVSDGDVLFAWSGSLMQKVWTEGTGALNQHLFKVTSETYQKWFFYYWIDHHMKWFQSIAASKATTMGHIQRSHLTEAKVCVPDSLILDAASANIAPLLEKQIQNSLENKTLTELRDTLLPKLMSGEIRVRDAERGMEATI
ncbi:MAG: restriction endonuclease subunit S [Candidatus Puniceispirillaceae bacterium]